MEHYESVHTLILQDGKIKSTPIASKSNIYSGETEEITCTDMDGNIITEEDYTSAADNYYTGYQKITTSLGWQDMSEVKSDASEIAAQLDMSLNVFLYSEP